MCLQVVRGINGFGVHGTDAIRRQHGVAQALAHLIALILQQNARLFTLDLRQMATALGEAVPDRT